MHVCELTVDKEMNLQENSEKERHDQEHNDQKSQLCNLSKVGTGPSHFHSPLNFSHLPSYPLHSHTSIHSVDKLHILGTIYKVLILSKNIPQS